MHNLLFPNRRVRARTTTSRVPMASAIKDLVCTLRPPFVNARDVLIRPPEVMRQFVNHDMRH